MNTTFMHAFGQAWSIVAARYATAILSTGVVIWVRSLLDPWLNEECPFSLFYLSALLTAWIAGTGPAIFAVALGTVAAAHFFIPPSSSLLIASVPDMVQLIMYVFVNCIAIFLFDRAERQRVLAENRSAENEQLSIELRTADLRKDEFLALLAHELRNPLAPIRSSLALLDRKPDSIEVVDRVRDVIFRQTMHLIRITDDLLDVSRFCRGKVELQVQPFDLRISVADAIEMVDCSMKSKSQRFKSLVPEQPIWVNGDRVRIAQLTANLLGNASKYTPEGGRITLDLEQVGDLISIVVTDNGIGFPPEQAERIIEPFVQIDASRTREYGGLGVGLTIVSRLVALHNGTLSATSRGPGMGSCFTVTFPAAQVSANSLQPDSSTPDQTLEPSRCVDTASLQQAVTIVEPPARSLLLVEDNADASAILSELFRSEGFHVELAMDGVEAIEKATQHRPQIIIMDIGLPGMDGYETARRIHRSRIENQAKMIALTGWGGSADREMAIDAGFDLHLIKPIGFRELLSAVETLTTQQPADGSPREASLV